MKASSTDGYMVEIDIAPTVLQMTAESDADAIHSHGWNGDGATVTLTGLTAGDSYQVQLLGAGGTRACCDTRNSVADDGKGNISDEFDRGNSSVIGSFTAAGETLDIMIAGGPNNGVDPGLSGLILTNAEGAVVSAFNIGRAADGADVTVNTSGGGGGDGRPAEVTLVTRSSEGVGVQFPEGTTYDVEYSTDLIEWAPIATGVTGLYNDTDAGRTANPSGYYRGIVK